MAHVALGCWPLPVGGRARGRFRVGDVLFLVFSGLGCCSVAAVAEGALATISGGRACCRVMSSHCHGEGSLQSSPHLQPPTIGCPALPSFCLNTNRGQSKDSPS